MTLAETRTALKVAKTEAEKSSILSKYRGNYSIFVAGKELGIRKTTIKSARKKADKEKEKQEKQAHFRAYREFKNKLNIKSLSEKSYKNLKQKSESILRDFCTGYSMGDMKILHVKNKGKKATISKIDNESEYSRSCKYRAQHGIVEIDLSLQDIKKIEKIEGVWTIAGKGNKAKWLSASGNYGNHYVWIESGYLIGTSHGKTIREAQRLERKKELAKMKSEEWVLKCRNNFIGIPHLKSAGACDIGIEAAVSKMKIDTHKIGGMTVGLLLDMAGKAGNYSYVMRWLRAAV